MHELSVQITVSQRRAFEAKLKLSSEAATQRLDEVAIGKFDEPRSGLRFDQKEKNTFRKIQLRLQGGKYGGSRHLPRSEFPRDTF